MKNAINVKIADVNEIRQAPVSVVDHPYLYTPVELKDYKGECGFDNMRPELEAIYQPVRFFENKPISDLKLFGRFILIMLCVSLFSCNTFKPFQNKQEQRPHFEKDLYPPFSRLNDTTITGYMTWYSLSYGPYILNDTTPYPIDEEGCYANNIYEVYVYKGMPRLTKYLSSFENGNYYDLNMNVLDRGGWCRQNELGLVEKPTEYKLQEPSLPVTFEIDSLSNYTLNDIEYILHGFLKNNTYDLFHYGPDSLFTYFTREGYAKLSVNTDRPISTGLGEKRRSFRMSNFPENYSDISVYPYPEVSELFDAFPLDLLNGNSCAFEIDKSRILCIECSKYYLRVKLKDGNEKLWAYYACPCSCDEAHLQVKGMQYFMEKLVGLRRNLPSDWERYRRKDANYRVFSETGERRRALRSPYFPEN